MRLQESPLRDLTKVYKALGDPTRLRILNLLREHGELCVCDLEAILGITQSKASRHVNYLKQSGIVDDRRDGTWVYYRISRAARAELRAVLRDIARQLSLDPQIAADHARAVGYERSAGCAPVAGVSSTARRGSTRGGR